MAQINLITTTYLKDNTTIEDNVDNSKLMPFIFKVQDIHIQHLLGSDFLTYLETQYAANALNANEDFLFVNYLKRTISEWTLFEAMPFLNFKMTNKSVAQESSQYSQPSQLSEIKWLRESVRNNAEFYSERLKKYLCDNSDLFPQYTLYNALENEKKDNRTYFSGIFMPNNGDNCGNC